MMFIKFGIVKFLKSHIQQQFNNICPFSIYSKSNLLIKQNKKHHLLLGKQALMAN